MKLAKNHVDVGLYVRQTAPTFEFWQTQVGAKFDHTLAMKRGVRQHRHDIFGSVLKINHSREPLPELPAAGYHELLVAREGLTESQSFVDPEGNRARLVPPGTLGVEKIGIRLLVRSLAAHTEFYARALGLAQEDVSGAGAAFRAGDSVILLDESPDAPSDAEMEGYGFRYITFQIFECDVEHANALAHGAREAWAPVNFGEVARVSMIKDPDGNWIELSQRKSIVGTLAPSH